jgi:hypothetical protein
VADRRMPSDVICSVSQQESTLQAAIQVLSRRVVRLVPRGFSSEGMSGRVRGGNPLQESSTKRHNTLSEGGRIILVRWFRPCLIAESKPHRTT